MKAPRIKPARAGVIGQIVSDRLALVSLGLLVLLVGISLAVLPFGDEALKQNLQLRLRPPAWMSADGHGLLGTDQLGRDLALRLAAGIRTSLLVGVGAVMLGFTLGTVFGVLAGFRRGWTDRLIVLFADVQLSFPALLMAMFLVSIIGQGIWPIVLILGLNSWMLYARMSRALTLGQRSLPYVEASVALGAWTPRVMWSHVLPNILPAMVGLALLESARVILGEASLSFLGFGLTTPTISLGLILADGREYLDTSWWVGTFAGAVLSLLVLALTVCGKRLQEMFDPLTDGGRR